MFTATDYAQTLIAAHQNKTEQEFEIFFSQFLEFLKSKKHEKMLPAIAVAISQLQRSTQNKPTTIITVRDKENYSELSEQIAAHSDNFDLESVEIVENPNIVGGYILRSDDSLVDASYRTALLDLYARLKS